MNVYILFHGVQDSGHEFIVGIYSTREKAEASKKEKEWPGFTPLTIEEWPVDTA